MVEPTNPYIAGNPLRNVQGFFGRQDVLDWVAHELRNPSTNALVLYGQRRIGKTSLLMQLQRTLPMDTFVPVYFDLHDQTTSPLGSVLADLADTVALQMQMASPKSTLFDHRGHYFQRTFLPQLYNTLGDNRRLVFLLDEFDVLEQIAKTETLETAAAKELFPFLRKVMGEDPRPAFVFVVGRQADDLSRDFMATFKTSLVREVWILNREEAESLIRQAEVNQTLHFTDGAVARILALTNSHPYLTQLLCQRLWERAYRKGTASVPLIEEQTVDDTVNDALQTGDNALIWIWNGLSPAEKIYSAALAEITKTEGQIITEDQVVKILATYAARLRSREIEIAPKYLIQRRVLEKVNQREYRFAVELFRRWVSSRRALAEVKEELDRIEPVAEQLYQVGREFFNRRQWEKAVGYFHDALNTYPTHLRAQLDLGEALLQQQQIREAVKAFEQAYELDHDEARLPLARALVIYAKSQDQAGQEDEALKICEQTLQISPSEKQAQDLREAIWLRKLKRAVEQSQPEIAFNAYQQLYAHQEKPTQQAVDLLRHIADNAPGYVPVTLRLGEVLLLTGNTEQAVTVLEGAYKFNPEATKSLLIRALLTFARTLEEQGKEEEALATSKWILELSPDEPEAQALKVAIWIRRGDVALELEEFDIALAAYERTGNTQKIEETKKRIRHTQYASQERDAAAFERSGEWERAAQIYRQLIEQTQDVSLLEHWTTALRQVEREMERHSRQTTAQHQRQQKPTDWVEGQHIGDKYEIVSMLARTERSEVYLANELQPPSQKVIIKRLEPGKMADTDAEQRFQREVILLRQIHHPSVLALYDSQTAGKERYIVTEYANIGTLTEYLRSHPSNKLKPAEALDIALLVCQGLQAIHRNSIIHRDIKPGNIFLFSQPEGSIQAKIADFSISYAPRNISNEPSTVTKNGWNMVTSAYASPEQLSGSKIDVKSDLYSWAIVFFEMLTGEFPTDSLRDPITYEPISDEFPIGFFTQKKIPQELAMILQKSLYREPEKRYQSATQIEHVLETIRSKISESIEKALSVSETQIQLRDWYAASEALEESRTLLEWYAPDKLPKSLEGSVGRLRSAQLCAQGMLSLMEKDWKAAIENLELLRALDAHYLGVDIAGELSMAQSRQQFAQKYQLLLECREQQDWITILRLATELTTSYKDSPDSESVSDLRKLALYARGKTLLDEGKNEEAYHHLYRLYETEPDYEDIADLCAIAAYRNSMRENPPLEGEQLVSWLERVIEVVPNHRNGRTQQELDRARHHWAESLFDVNKYAAIIQLEKISETYNQWPVAYRLLVNAYSWALRDGTYVHTEWANTKAEGEARYRLGTELWRKDALQEAVSQLKEVPEDAKDYGQSRLDLAQVYTAMGDDARKDREWQKAIGHWENAILLNPELQNPLQKKIREAKIRVWIAYHDQEIVVIGLVVAILSILIPIWSSCGARPPLTPTATQSIIIPTTPSPSATITPPSKTSTPTISPFPIVITPSPTTETPTITPSPKPTINTPTNTPTKTPTLTPTHTPTPTLTFTPTPTPTTPPPTSTPVTPQLSAPGQGQWLQNPIQFQWVGKLLTGQTYQVTVIHVETGYVVTSELLDTPSWSVNLPADKYKEWRWSVAVVQKGVVVATSASGTFNLDPGFGSGGTFITPTATPIP